MEKSDYSKLILVQLIVITVLIGGIMYLVINPSFRYSKDTKDHFVNGLKQCINEKKSLENDKSELIRDIDKFYAFFNVFTCKNSSLKDCIGIQYVPNWIISSDYKCDIMKIISKQPDNDRKKDRWNSSINCYKCNAP